MITFDKPQEFFNLKTMSQAAHNAIENIKYPLMQELLRKMLHVNPSDRMDFINLSNFFESKLNPEPPKQLTIESGVNCFSCKQSSNLLQCTNCWSEFHPECLRKMKYVCNNCSIDLSSKFEMLHCLKCFKEVPREIFQNKCGHNMCLECRPENFQCLSCIGFEIFDSYQGDYSQLNILNCPTDGVLMLRDKKTIFCSTHIDYRLCIVCKNYEHQNSCAVIGQSNRFHCIMCNTISYKESSAFLVDCLNCSSNYCQVCLKPTNSTSHQQCANLFGFTN